MKIFHVNESLNYDKELTALIYKELLQSNKKLMCKQENRQKIENRQEQRFRKAKQEPLNVEEQYLTSLIKMDVFTNLPVVTLPFTEVSNI